MSTKSRNVGALNPKAVLDETKVHELRASKETTTAIARRLGVSRTCIHYARTGKTWKHLQRKGKERKQS